MSATERDIVEAVLEPLVDQHGLEFVVAGLALLCFEKADHLRHAWQDSESARLWDANGRRIENLVRSLK